MNEECGITTWLSGELETPNGKGSWKTVLAHYITSNHALKGESAHNSCRQYKVKLNRLRIRHTRINAACGNQTLTIKHYFEKCPSA